MRFFRHPVPIGKEDAISGDAPIERNSIGHGTTIREALNKSDFVVILRDSQKISPYLSSICCADIFFAPCLT